MKRLHAETNSALDLLIQKKQRMMAKTWGKTRRDLRGTIFSWYRSAAARGRWNISGFNRVAHSMTSEIHRHLAMFHAVSKNDMRVAFAQIRRASVLRHAWMLDQATPDNIKIKAPRTDGVKESARAREADAGTDASWGDRWDAWVDSYASAITQNLRMGALNGSSVDDAADEVDATRTNTPASTLQNALERLLSWQAVAMISAGEQDVVDMNEDAVDEEVWKTRGDKLVCDDCDANEGLTADAAEGDIPLHPHCNCFWEVVPKAYADLLRSGDADDNDLADQLQARGLVPISMVIRGADGGIAAKAVVNFNEWVEGQSRVLGGGI